MNHWVNTGHPMRTAVAAAAGAQELMMDESKREKESEKERRRYGGRVRASIRLPVRYRRL